MQRARQRSPGTYLGHPKKGEERVSRRNWHIHKWCYVPSRRVITCVCGIVTVTLRKKAGLGRMTVEFFGGPEALPLLGEK